MAVSSSSSQYEWVEVERDFPCTMVDCQGELMHLVFEHGEEEGMMPELFEDDANSVVFQGGVVQEPRVCLALDELIPVNEVWQA